MNPMDEASQSSLATISMASALANAFTRRHNADWRSTWPVQHSGQRPVATLLHLA